MKKALVLLLVLAMVLSVTAVGFAQAEFGIVSIEITPTSTEDAPILVEQGETVTLTATTTLGQGTYTFIEDFWTNADPLSSPEENAQSTEEFVATAEFSADGLEVGSEHTITYRITVNRPGGGPSGTDYEDSDEAYIEIIEQELTIVVEPMAAPAIAAKILEMNGVQARYGQGRNGGNFIADVARQMEPQTMFNDVEKAVWCDEADAYVSNPDYWDAVLAFLNNHSRMTHEGLDCAYDWYVSSLE